MRKRNIIVGCTIAFAVIGLLLGLFSFVAPVSSSHFTGRTSSRTASLGLYSDSACTKILTSLDWGAIASGNSAIQTFYLKNLGSSYLLLSMSTTNWNPSSADGVISLSWDKEGFQLAPNSVTSATMKLSVSPNASGLTTFNFDTVVNGETWKPHHRTR